MKRFVGRKRRINGYDIAMMAVLLVFALMALYPFLFTLAGSLNDAQDYQYGGVWLIPRKFTWASYIVILKDERLYRALFNTLIVTLVSVVVSLLFTSMVAYAMSRKKLKGSRVFWFLNMVPMFISGGMIPSYMLIIMTGLFNTYFVYIIPTMFSVFNMIVLCNFFRGSITACGNPPYWTGRGNSVFGFLSICRFPSLLWQPSAFGLPSGNGIPTCLRFSGRRRATRICGCCSFI